MQEEDYYNDYWKWKFGYSMSKKKLKWIFKEDNLTKNEMDKFMKNKEVISNWG